LPRNAFLETRLQPGEILVFNNRRMLHGRRAFTLPGGCARRLIGAYVGADEWRSRLSVLAHAGHATGAFRVRRVGNGGLA
jgi:gamma-butyrobetaine dioxygenase